MTRDPTLYTWWLVSRAAGVTAFVLASAAVILGLAMSGRLSRRPGGNRRLLALHEYLAVGMFAAVAVHGLALLGDHWLHPGVLGLLVPLHMAYRPLATSLGILAGYGMAALGLSFYLRRRIGARRWRKAHRFIPVFWTLCAAHAITAGSDASTPWMRAILGASTAAIAVLMLARIAEGMRASRRRAAATGRRAPRQGAVPARPTQQSLGAVVR